jgi:hypothetical protein
MVHGRVDGIAYGIRHHSWALWHFQIRFSEKNPATTLKGPSHPILNYQPTSTHTNHLPLSLHHRLVMLFFSPAPQLLLLVTLILSSTSSCILLARGEPEQTSPSTQHHVVVGRATTTSEFTLAQARDCMSRHVVTSVEFCLCLTDLNVPDFHYVRSTRIFFIYRVYIYIYIYLEYLKLC